MTIHFHIPEFWLGVLLTVVGLPVLLYIGALIYVWFLLRGFR
jgi:hypothetical protein